MTTHQEDYETVVNHRLISQVSEYYNHTLRDLEFYRALNNATLQNLSHEHLHYWKNELKSLIFNGMNCTSERSA